jgi:hypothetical protein
MDDPKAWAYCCLNKLKEHYLLKVKLSTNKGGMDPGQWFLMKHTKLSRNLEIDLTSVPELMGMDDKQEKMFLAGVGRNYATTLEQQYGNSIVVRRYKNVWFFTFKPRHRWNKKLEGTSVERMLTSAAKQHFSFNLVPLARSPSTGIPTHRTGEELSHSRPDF